MFPQGGPGAALLLLRISVAATLFSIRSSGRGTFAEHWVYAGALVAAILLCLGFLTPVVSVLAACFEAAALLLPGPADSPLILISALNAVALALLGPGAYSLDARLFGRRVLVVPVQKDRSRS
jgi:uncharacterized membrane protein YphA (DoxX/SURF4 family)